MTSLPNTNLRANKLINIVTRNINIWVPSAQVEDRNTSRRSGEYVFASLACKNCMYLTLWWNAYLTGGWKILAIGFKVVLQE